MHLAEHGGAIPGCVELACEGRLIRGQWCWKARDACAMREHPREKRLPRWRADRRVAVVAGEPSALGSQAVEVGRSREAVAIGAEDVPGMVVRQNEQEIGLRFRTGVSARSRGQDKGATRDGAKAVHPYVTSI